MKLAVTCPTRQELQRLRLGHVPFADVEQLAQHLEQCDVCVRLFQTLPEDDTLVEDTARPFADLGKPPDPVVLQLMERVGQIPRSGGGSEGERGGDAAPGL